VEEGSHDDLMRANGLYEELFTLQAASYLWSSEETRAGSGPDPTA
jgi:hypothetical protein